MKKKITELREKLDRAQAVIFDMDGTLVDSMWIWKEIDIEFLKERGISFPKDLQDIINGKSFAQTAAYFRERFALKETEEELMEIWNAMAGEKYRKVIPYKDGAEEFLEILKKQGVRMALATSNSRELVEGIGERLQFSKYFSCILTSAEVVNGKPAPDIYLKAAQNLKVSAENCVVFEDVVQGAMAGTAAGMTVCAVWDFSAKHRWEEICGIAPYHISGFHELLSEYGV